MPAHLAFPWLYRLAVAGAEEGTRARWKIDAALGDTAAAAELEALEPIDRRNAAVAAGVEVG